MFQNYKRFSINRSIQCSSRRYKNGSFTFDERSGFI